jgi:hypothetical protein
MKSVNRQSTAPVTFPRSRRNHALAVLTSMPAGKCVPLAVMPMLREDSLRSFMRINVEMLETKELLANPVNLRVTAYVVPLLALARFEGSRDQFDRSYMGEPKVDGGAVVPFIETQAMGAHGANAVYKALGLHGKTTDQVNTAYLEAYNAIWNFRARNRSPHLTERTRLDATLAPAFWHHSRFQHVVPDFDQAVIDGEIALNLVASQLGLSGAAAITGSPAITDSGNSFRLGHGSGKANPRGLQMANGAGTVTWDAVAGQSSTDVRYERGLAVSAGTLAVDLSAVVAEMTEGGVSISLSNLELARKTQAFAKMRERYQEHDDEWIIDMLMDGLSIPDQALKQPILLADRMVNFGQVKRYATDGGNLAESAVSGGASLELNLRVPRLQTGGVVMVVAEAVPEQLFERQRDPFFHSANVDAWPEALRDTLDPEKVDVVQNAEIDVLHSTGTNTFGYAPMNWKWNAWGPRVGGKFYRPTTDPLTDTTRQRLWAVEVANPALSADFYIVSSMHTKPFLDTASDPFEASLMGAAVIEGNTQFGGVLVEATSNYDDVLAKAPQERIDKP